MTQQPPSGASYLEAGSGLVGGISDFIGSRIRARGLRHQADGVEADGTRAADQQRRRGDIIGGAAELGNAANGGAFDAGMVERLARIHAETDVNVGTILYGSRLQADALRKEAKSAKTQGLVSLFSSAAKAGAQIAGDGA